MKKYNWFQKFIDSMAPTELYTYCQKEKFGKTLLYFFGLVLLVASLSGGYLGQATRTAFQNTLSDFESNKLAPISYSPEKGLVYEGEGYAIIDYFFQPVIIDTQNAIDARVLYNMKDYILLSNSELSIVEKGIGFHLKYKDFGLLYYQDLSFSDIKSLLLAFVHTLIPTFIIASIINIMIFFLSSGLFVLLTVNIFNLFRGIRIKFGKLVQFVMYAMTVPILWKGLYIVLLVAHDMPYDRVIVFIDNLLIYFYPVILLSIVFRRIKKQIINS